MAYTTQINRAYEVCKKKGVAITILHSVPNTDDLLLIAGDSDGGSLLIAGNSNGGSLMIAGDPDIYDPITETGGSTSVSFPTYMVLTKYSDYFVNGQNIKTGDRKGIIPFKGMTFDLSQGDKIKVTGSNASWIVHNPGDVAPDATPIIYEAHLRK